MLAKKILETVPFSIRVVRALFREELGNELSLNQMRLMKLVNEGLGQTAIAEHLDISLAAVSKMTDALEGKGLVARRAGKDKRTYLLRVTAKGEKLLQKMKSKIEARLDFAIDDLSSAQKEILMQGLVELEALMKKVKKD